MTPIRRDDPRSAAQQIADDIREQIASGRLRPGGKLPSTMALCEEWGVVDGTVRKAIDLLRADGLLTSWPGRGVYVRDQAVLPHLAGGTPGGPAGWDAYAEAAGWDTFAGAAEMHGRNPHRDVSHHRRRASTLPADVVQRLGLAPDAPLVVRTEVRRVDDDPWSVQITYSPADLATSDGQAGEAKDDVPYVAAAGLRDEWIVRAPTRDEAEVLRIAAGSGIKLLVRTSSIAGRVAGRLRVARVVRDLLPDDRNRVIYEAGDDDALRLLDQAAEDGAGTVGAAGAGA